MSSTPPALQPPVQTIITGTERARTAFDPNLRGALLVHEQCIVVDLSLLDTLPQHKTARLIAVVNNAAELYTATLHKPHHVAVVAVCNLEESIRIRHAALHDLSSPGLIIVRNNSRAKDVFARIVRAWRAHDAEETAWGDAVFAEESDIIIPPGWDSDGKISAVIDAAGLALNQILEDSSWGTVVKGGALDLGDEEALRNEAAAERVRANEKSRQWIERLQKIESSRDKSSSTQGQSSTGAGDGETPAPQSNFFQKLLAEMK